MAENNAGQQVLDLKREGATASRVTVELRYVRSGSNLNRGRRAVA